MANARTDMLEAAMKCTEAGLDYQVKLEKLVDICKQAAEQGKRS